MLKYKIVESFSLCVRELCQREEELICGDAELQHMYCDNLFSNMSIIRG